MKRFWIMLPAVAVLASWTHAAQPQTLASEKERISYALGTEAGRNAKRLGIELDVDALMKGLEHALSGAKPLLSEEELEAARRAYQSEMSKKLAQARKQAAQDNAKAGEAFLAANRKKPGVVTLPSGLQYKILQAGKGRKPTDRDTVACQYRGTLVDGTEFDSSYRREKPATFKVSGVIPGWREALKLMPLGSKWQLVVPPKLAYGARGAGRTIGPNATLIFEVELLAIK